jgi:hypothetical protein
MRRSCLIALLFLGFHAGLRASEDFSPPNTNPEIDQPKVDGEGEDEGIIPKTNDLVVSSQTVTPVTKFPQKNLIDQAKEELIRAQALLAKGNSEAASDTSLEAYDDFCDVRVPRKKRKFLFVQRHQAATVYMNASITYIKEYVEKSNKSLDAIQEGHARLDDLHDVAQNYPELTKMLAAAHDELSAIKPR